MDRPFAFKKWLLIGVLLELVIFAYSYFNFVEAADVFRYAARYSGRLSFIVYLVSCFFFASSYPFKAEHSFNRLKKVVTIFCVLHLIHFGFLASSVLLNEIELVPFKVAGGALAYLMIVSYPFLIERFKNRLAAHLVYFYYVGIVMALTYLARLKGDFPGAESSPVHYLGISAVVLAFIGIAISISRKRK